MTPYQETTIWYGLAVVFGCISLACYGLVAGLMLVQAISGQ